MHSLLALLVLLLARTCGAAPLRFRPDGRFKILQVADMHYANGGETRCKDVLAWQHPTCSDLNTTAFVRRLLAAEKPDLIVFTGDNIFGRDAKDPIASLNAAFAPAIEARIPWAAILGNHDQESSLSRRDVMEHIVSMNYTLSQVFPSEYGRGGDANSTSGGSGSKRILTDIDGFGNYHLRVNGAVGSIFQNRTLLNLFMLDSGDYSKDRRVSGYGWIQESQKQWFEELSDKLKEEQKEEQRLDPEPNPTTHGLVYFHIPLRETRMASVCAIVGKKQEAIGCSNVNTGFLGAMEEARNVRAVFIGHDHVNDFCGTLGAWGGGNIKVCYGGGVGYHAYGKAGWPRRARVVLVSLAKRPYPTNDSLPDYDYSSQDFSMDSSSNLSTTPTNDQWLGVESISTWKLLDDDNLSIIDSQVLWSSSDSLHNSSHRWWYLGTHFLLPVFVCLSLLSLLFTYSMSYWPFRKKIVYTNLHHIQEDY